MASPNRKNFRLTTEAKDMLIRLSDKLGLSEAGVVEMAIRRLAEQEGVKLMATDICEKCGINPKGYGKYLCFDCAFAENKKIIEAGLPGGLHNYHKVVNAAGQTVGLVWDQWRERPDWPDIITPEQDAELKQVYQNIAEEARNAPATPAPKLWPPHPLDDEITIAEWEKEN